jgi:acyl-[acyl-carrier-protein]-phospholipid O-acyltransferase/long-chain-fatty-acid--[acyl-carrier-protein] ligase
MIDMFLISSFCGIFVVPLYAILQKNSPIEKCAQTIAASNVISALMMICTSIISLLLLSIIGLPVSKLILLISIMNLGLSMYLLKILPFTSVKPILARILRWFFKIEVNGLEHFQTANNRLIIIANHISFLDAILLALFLPDQYIFAINTDIARLPFIRFIQQFFETCEIDPTNPIRIKNLAKSIMSGKKCIIFPEGRLTNTGGIMKIYEGFAALAQMTDADIIPVHLSNSLRHAAKITRVGDRYRQRMSVKVSITVFPAFKPENDPNISAKENRTKNVDEIYDKLAYCQYAAEPRMPIYNALLQAAKDHGYGYNILEDFTSKKKVNYRNVILKSQILGQKIYELTKNESNIGFFLPNTNAGVITFFGMLAYRKVPTMLNYTGGSKNIANSCITAGLKTIVTSRSFISKGNLSEELSVIKSHVDQVIFLEDIANDIRTMDKIKSFWRYLNIDRFYKRNPKLTPPIDSPAVILFTSGSEGSPKGVVLSHRNICANIHQSTATMDLNPTDVMFNALPMFHAFGLNLGTLTPILIGIKTYLYPNPKHYSTVVELIYDTRATLLIGTNTFLSAYLKFSKQYDFSNLRIVFTGGEKLQNETRIAWLEQRGITLLEGYGSTECGPVISSNTLMHHRAGSVGKTLPGIQTRYNPFPDLEIGGELCVRGENIMLGYLLLENPGKIVPLPNGWYDTGDIVSYDEQDFISIIDRIKRFAKISGEMISLSAIEGEVATCWPEYQHGVVSIPDPKRGEKLILITNKPDPDRIELARKLKAQGVSPLSVPNQIEVMDQLPLLSTGKINYPQLIAFIKKVSSKTKTFLRRKS